MHEYAIKLELREGVT